MSNFRPIAMKCNQEQFDDIKPLLESGGMTINKLNPFREEGHAYLVNNFLDIKGYIINLVVGNTDLYNRTIFEQWNKSIFLEYCDILPEKWCVKATPETVDLMAHFWDKTLGSDNVYESLKSEYNNYYWYSHNLASGVSMFEPDAGSNYISKSIRDGFTEITFDQFYSRFISLEEKTKTKMYNIKGSDIKRLYDTIQNSCSWRDKVFNLYGKNMLDDTMCQVDETLFQEALRDANSTQRVLLDEIFNIVDFNILNDEDVFWLEAKSLSYLFKGSDPFTKPVKGYSYYNRKGFECGICQKSSVKTLRKATKQEEELYYSIWPKFNVGDYVYVIDGGWGARGADRKIGKIVSKDDIEGLGEYKGDDKYNAKLFIQTSDGVWGLADGYKARLATEEEIDSFCPFKDGEYIVVWNYSDSLFVRKFKVKINKKFSCYVGECPFDSFSWDNAMSLTEFNKKYNG